MRLWRFLGAGLAWMAVMAGGLAAQSLSGVVVDSRSGRALEGARVAVDQAASTEVRTDNRGRFTLTELPGTDVTLRITMIGYRLLTQAARVGATDLQILLTEQALNLGELVVTGTPEAVERRTLGNSSATVHAADQQALAPAPDISNLINSRAPGVMVIPGTGQVGSGPQIRIRGVNSFSLNGNPLIYIDGARVNNSVAQGMSVQGFSSGISSRLNDIDPDQIESIEIIKGPAAATLYGTEATNGVIQIITKRGKAGTRPIIGVQARQGTNWFMNPEGRLVHPVALVNGVETYWNAVQQERERHERLKRNPHPDSMSAPLFRNGYMMGYGANISGGTESVRYFAGSAFDADNGIEPTNDLRRLTTNLNLTISGGETFDVQTSFGFVKSKVNQAFEGGAGGVWFSTLFGNPLLVPLPRRGFASAPPEFQWGSRQAMISVNRFTGSVAVNHRPMPWLSHRLTVGLDQTDQASEQLNRYLPPQWVQYNPGVGRFGLKYKDRQTTNLTTFDYSATARMTLAGALSSSSSVGAQYYRRRTDQLAGQGEQFPAPDLDAISAASIFQAAESYVENATLGMYVQQQFGLGDRFYLTGAVRVDNNSAFGDDFDLVAYPKLSLAYIVRENAPGVLNTLKLRSAYGQAGQQPAAFTAVRSWSPIVTGNGVAAAIPQFVGNPNLRPERAEELEIGADAGMFDDRLGFSVTGFSKKTRDAIMARALAPSLGYTGAQFINVGAIKNHGVEFEIFGTPIRMRNLALDLRFSIATNDNEILALGTNADGTPITTFGPGGWTVGQPVDGYYARRVVQAELNAAGQAINVLCDDGAGGGLPCAAAPPIHLGRQDPKMEGAFSATVTLWNRLRLYGLADFKQGNLHTDNNRRAMCQVLFTCIENIRPHDFDPKVIAEMQSGGTVTSFVASDASFIKLRELSLAYSMPRAITRWFGAADGTFAISGRNLHTWTGYSGLEPEAYFVTEARSRLEQSMTPQLASVNFSLNLTF